MKLILETSPALNQARPNTLKNLLFSHREPVSWRCPYCRIIKSCKNYLWLRNKQKLIRTAEQTATKRSTIMTVTLKRTISNAGVKDAVIIESDTEDRSLNAILP